MVLLDMLKTYEKSAFVRRDLQHNKNLEEVMKLGFVGF